MGITRGLNSQVCEDEMTLAKNFKECPAHRGGSINVSNYYYYPHCHYHLHYHYHFSLHGHLPLGFRPLAGSCSILGSKLPAVESEMVPHAGSLRLVGKRNEIAAETAAAAAP